MARPRQVGTEEVNIRAIPYHSWHSSHRATEPATRMFLSLSN
jgi:hypothetical protein